MELHQHSYAFAIDNKDFIVDLKKHTIKEAWDSEVFEKFRMIKLRSCDKCKIPNCRNCPLDLGINLCGKICNP